MNLSCFATGFLGWELGLDLSRTITITIFSTLLGSAVTVSDFHTSQGGELRKNVE